MKKTIGNTGLMLAAIMLAISSCSTVKNSNKAQRGAVIGAAAGGVIGGVVGNNVGNKNNTVLGAIIGAAAGGVIGGVIGNKMDKQAEKIKNEIPGAQVERVGEGIIVTFSEKNPDGSKMGVYFETNKSELSANSKLALDKLVQIFKEYPETNLMVAGHTDDVGTDAYNLALSEKRAMAVGDYLKTKNISPSRLSINWFGESQPKVDNSSVANRAENRRVEFAITANEKMKEAAKTEAAGE